MNNEIKMCVIHPGNERPGEDGDYIIWVNGVTKFVRVIHGAWCFWHEESPSEIQKWMKVPVVS